MKSTAKAPSNIAFIKYWGKKDDRLRLPENSSISMNLSALYTVTTVEFDPKYKRDCVLINGTDNRSAEARVIEHLDRIRKLSGIKLKAKVKSINNFPQSTGLSSSASSFAALTLAGTASAGLTLSERELSVLSRKASGSSCRSIPAGFVEWHTSEEDENSFAETLFPSSWWDIFDFVLVLNREKKKVSSTQGQQFASTSPFFKIRQKSIKDKISILKKHLKEKDFSQFGSVIEAEALEMHSVMMTSTPALIYLYPQTLDVIRKVYLWRSQGLEVYFTINTGQNIHLICQSKSRDFLQKKLQTLKFVKKVYISRPAEGTKLRAKHLF